MHFCQILLADAYQFGLPAGCHQTPSLSNDRLRSLAHKHSRDFALKFKLIGERTARAYLSAYKLNMFLIGCDMELKRAEGALNAISTKGKTNYSLRLCTDFAQDLEKVLNDLVSEMHCLLSAIFVTFALAATQFEWFLWHSHDWTVQQMTIEHVNAFRDGDLLQLIAKQLKCANRAVGGEQEAVDAGLAPINAELAILKASEVGAHGLCQKAAQLVDKRLGELRQVSKVFGGRFSGDLGGSRRVEV